MGFTIRRAALAALFAAGLLGGPTHTAVAATQQITEDHSLTSCSSWGPVADATATIVAWQSDCDPTGGNMDGSQEIYRATIGSAPVQLTSASGCTSGLPAISSDGSKVAFQSTCDLTGSNPDGNFEIFLWSGGVLDQLTNSVGCDNLDPAISGNGKFVAYDSTCNLQGTNNNGHGSEIFRLTLLSKLLKQLTDDAIGDCDSTSPSLDGSGALVAFDSDCNLTGRNEDYATEIFTVTGAGAITQKTFAKDDACSSVRPSMDAAAATIAFHSNCDFTASNVDRGDEIFTLDVATSAVRQVTDASAAANCASSEARIAASGKALVFSSYCKFGDNADGSIEVFQKAVGATTGAALAVTSGTSCTSVAGAISASGGRVLLDSDCNLTGGNADGGVEVFRAEACVCGAPATRVAKPVASDALLTLRAAVGSGGCLACECDTNNDGAVTASDALRVLKFAVGQVGVALGCPPAS